MVRGGKPRSGTKCPSKTSRWTKSTSAASSRASSSARRPWSALKRAAPRRTRAAGDAAGSTSVFRLNGDRADRAGVEPLDGPGEGNQIDALLAE